MVCGLHLLRLFVCLWAACLGLLGVLLCVLLCVLPAMLLGVACGLKGRCCSRKLRWHMDVQSPTLPLASVNLKNLRENLKNLKNLFWQTLAVLGAPPPPGRQDSARIGFLGFLGFPEGF